jgi:hypothetical protein
VYHLGKDLIESLDYHIQAIEPRLKPESRMGASIGGIPHAPPELTYSLPPELRQKIQVVEPRLKLKSKMGAGTGGIPHAPPKSTVWSPPEIRQKPLTSQRVYFLFLVYHFSLTDALAARLITLLCGGWPAIPRTQKNRNDSCLTETFHWRNPPCAQQGGFLARDQVCFSLCITSLLFDALVVRHIPSCKARHSKATAEEGVIQVLTLA